MIKRYLGLAVFVGLAFPAVLRAETIKAKIGGGLYQGPRQFIVVDIEEGRIRAKYVENVTTWCPFSCPWYDHKAIAYQACPIKKAGDFTPANPKECLTGSGETLLFPEGKDPNNYAIKFQYRKGGIVQEKEFTLSGLRNRQRELSDPNPGSSGEVAK